MQEETSSLSEDNQNENIEFQSHTNTSQENNISIKKSS